MRASRALDNPPVLIACDYHELHRVVASILGFWAEAAMRSAKGAGKRA
jgi:hypothetical protein